MIDKLTRLFKYTFSPNTILKCFVFSEMSLGRGRYRLHMLQRFKSAPLLEFEQNSIADWFKMIQNT